MMTPQIIGLGSQLSNEGESTAKQMLESKALVGKSSQEFDFDILRDELDFEEDSTSGNIF